jgi:ATPases involved in chromosome partitioning
MTLTGFVVSDAHWEIVKQGLPQEVIVGWVVSTPEAADEYLATPGTELVIVEAVPEILTSDLVTRIDSEGIPLAALLTSAESAACAEERGVGHRIRQPDDLRRLIGIAPAEKTSDGHVWCVWGPHGSPGRTTIALGIAAQLASRGQRVLVVDADTQGGTVAPALGLIDKTPGFWRR